MSIEQNWKDLNEQQDEDLGALLQPGLIRQIQSSDPLEKIKKNLRMNMIWALLIAGMYVVILICFPFWQVIISIGIVLVFTVWGGYTAFLQYKKIQPAISGNQPLLKEMEHQYKRIRAWMSLQLKVAIFVYPAASIGGMFIGLMLGSGKSIEYMLSKPAVLQSLLIVTAILVPGGLYLAKWLLKKSFGKHLADLKKNIDELKAVQ